VNGVKVIYGIFIATLMFLTNFSPKNPKELFNLRHSSLWNAVERIFGVLKKRFKVLTYQLEYPFKIQVRLVNVMRCLHHIIRIAEGDDMFDEMWEKDISAKVLVLNQDRSDQSGEAVIRKVITARETKQAERMR